MTLTIFYTNKKTEWKFDLKNVRKIEETVIDDVEGFEIQTVRRGYYFFAKSEVKYILIA